jgi:hypothetical protein
MKEPGLVQRLIDVARIELLLVIGVVIKLAAALLCVEGLSWIIALTPMPQPPAAMTVAAKAVQPVDAPALKAAQAAALSTTGQ